MAETSPAPAENAAEAQSENDEAAAEPKDDKPGKSAPISSGKKLGIALIAAVVLLVGGMFGLRAYRFGQTHVSTDDAFVTGNLVNIAPIIGGSLKVLTIEDGDRVRWGQLIARLGSSGQEASLRQARADVDKTAKDRARYEKLLAQEAVTPQQFDAVNAQYEAAQSTLASLNDQVAQARSQVEQARDVLVQNRAQVQAARRAAEASEEQVAVALAGVTVAEANAG